MPRPASLSHAPLSPRFPQVRTVLIYSGHSGVKIRYLSLVETEWPSGISIISVAGDVVQILTWREIFRMLWRGPHDTLHTPPRFKYGIPHTPRTHTRRPRPTPLSVFLPLTHLLLTNGLLPGSTERADVGLRDDGRRRRILPRATPAFRLLCVLLDLVLVLVVQLFLEHGGVRYALALFRLGRPTRVGP